MKDDRRFPRTGPGMLALVEHGQAIFWLKGLFDQSHVVLLAQSVQREHRSQDRRCLHTDEHRSVDTARENGAISRNDKLIEGVLVYLTDLCRIGDGEHKGLC